MLRQLQPCGYILASAFNGTLYVVVTSNLPARIVRHCEGAFDSFTSRFAIHRLVYVEAADRMDAAIAREKQLKRYIRDWKRNLIEREKPLWDDLAPALLGLPPLRPPPGGTMDPGTSPG